MIFDENWFFKKLEWIWISMYMYLDVPILIHMCMPLSGVLDLAEAAFHQITKRNTQPNVLLLQNLITFTVYLCEWCIFKTESTVQHKLSAHFQLKVKIRYIKLVCYK